VGDSDSDGVAALAPARRRSGRCLGFRR